MKSLILILFVSLTSYGHDCQQVLNSHENLKQRVRTGQATWSQYYMDTRATIKKLEMPEIKKRLLKMYNKEMQATAPHPFLSRWYTDMDRIIALDLHIWSETLNNRVYLMNNLEQWFIDVEDLFVLNQFMDLKYKE